MTAGSQTKKKSSKREGNAHAHLLCRLVLHENLYYATREVGRLYETGRCLHNYALTYALGFVLLLISRHSRCLDTPKS